MNKFTFRIWPSEIDSAESEFWTKIAAIETIFDLFQNSADFG